MTLNLTKANSMTKTHRQDGSFWQRWDLHLHAPGTKLSNSFGEANDENLRIYLEALEKSDVQVFGITDYFSFDCYLKVINAYDALHPHGEKVFFPNVEFRLIETVSPDIGNVHTHVLIDPEWAMEAKLETLLSDLPTHITKNNMHVRCSELSSEADYEQAAVHLTDLQAALKKGFPDETAYMIVTAAGNDGLRSVDTRSPRRMSISDELDKASHAFFGSAVNTEYFLKEDRYEDDTKAEKKPVYSGSDAHSFDDLSRLSGDEKGFAPTWIKADRTFRGLRQTLFEPKGRVHIGERPTVLGRLDQDATRFIAEVRIDQVEGYDETNGSWFKNVAIPFNPELTAIIGNKGSGKSAVTDILGLLGESHQHQHFSFLTDDSQNRKFRQRGYAEHFTGTLKWASGTECLKRLDNDVDKLKPEAIKYLPQNYFESLTNEIEVQAFRKEIEKVVFSHVDGSERMGKASFAELEDLMTAKCKSDISTLKVRLRELNIEIIALEQQAAPSTKDRLTEQLNQKYEEYRVLENSKPAEVPKPASETPEQQKISTQIEQLRALQSRITEQCSQTTDRLSAMKSNLVALGSLKESVNSLGAQVKETKEELRSLCERFELDIDIIVSHQVNTDPIDRKTGKITAEINKLEAQHNDEISESTDFSGISSIPGLRKADQFLSEQLKTLQESLSAPQLRYQRYLQTLSQITKKMSDIMGEDEEPKPSTIKDLQQRIRYIEQDLQAKLEKRYNARDELSRSIFASKEKVRSFYEGLKSSIEERLDSIRSDEFNVMIDASFAPSHSFPDDFFSLINQTALGPFRGMADGRAELSRRTTDVDWNDIDSVLRFGEAIMEDIQAEDISKQVKDIKRLYDLLFSFEYFNPHYELRLGDKNLNQLSPGEKGLLLLVFYLHLDKENTPLIIDQPEDNLDNDSIFSVLARCIREAKKSRQVVLVTHNPNLAVGADAEQILYVSLDKAGNYKFTYKTGSIENPTINDAIVKILEGSKPAFVQRRLKYQIQ